MNKQETLELLEDTFSQNFDLSKFIKFIRELFNKFDVDSKSWSVWQEYDDYIESYQQIGSYKDKNRVIDVLVVKIKKTNFIDRSRAMQRNFVAKYLNNAQKDAALVAFYGDDTQDRKSVV